MASAAHDVIIIGGGPTGLFGAFYAGLRGMSVNIIDSLEELGGQLTTLYPEKFIYDVAGFPAVLAKTLVNELARQANQYEPTINCGEQVKELESSGDNLFTVTTDRAVHTGRSVVICAGAGAFSPKRLPTVDCEPYEGQGVYYFVKDIAACRGKKVLIIGGGDSAVDWGLNLLRVTDDITLIHRSDRFRAHEDSVTKLHESNVRIMTHYELREIHGDGQVEGAVIVNNQNEEAHALEVDLILVNIGFSSTLGPIRDWGLELDKDGIIVNSRMETNRPGVYAAGDVASFPGKLKLIATGFGEAATAVNHAKSFIDPKSKSFPGHSSSTVPKQRKAAAPPS